MQRKWAFGAAVTSADLLYSKADGKPSAFCVVFHIMPNSPNVFAALCALVEYKERKRAGITKSNWDFDNWHFDGKKRECIL